MELRHLRYFAAVATDLNFTRAAARLHVAQPALSRQIRQLEEELGVALLTRSPRGVTLTRHGRTFLEEARALLQHSERVMRPLRKTSEQALNVGYIWGLFHSLVPPWLEAFRRRHPGSTAHLFDLTPAEQARALLEGKLDAGFIGFECEAGVPGLSQRQVGKCRFVAALPRGHALGRLSKIPLTRLGNELFLGISEQTYPGASRCVSAAFARAGVRPKYVQMVERGFTILGLVAGGGGLALVPESLQALPHAGVVFRPLTQPPTADLYVAWRADNPSAALPQFLAVLPANKSNT